MTRVPATITTVARLVLALALSLGLGGAPAQARSPQPDPRPELERVVPRTLPAEAVAAPAPWVARWQRRLNELRCDSGRADGRMDLQARSAVVRFQSRHGLAQTGRRNPATRQRLFSPTARRCDLRPVPARSGRGERIVISQKQNWIWMTGRLGKAYAQGPMIDNSDVLRPGSYRVGSYCGRAARIPRNMDAGYKYWLDNFVRFAPCGIGFHQIPINRSTGKRLHARWLLGTNFDRSAGCIRLATGLSDRVWKATARPLPVIVVGSR